MMQSRVFTSAALFCRSRLSTHANFMNLPALLLSTWKQCKEQNPAQRGLPLWLCIRSIISGTMAGKSWRVVQHWTQQSTVVRSCREVNNIYNPFPMLEHRELNSLRSFSGQWMNSKVLTELCVYFPDYAVEHTVFLSDRCAERTSL